MWIWIANKFAKFHAKRLNRSENISKSFFFWGGGTFLKHPVHLSVHSVQVRVVGEAVSFIDMLMIEL